MANGTELRGIALEILLEITQEKEYSHLAIRNALNKVQYLPKQDRAFINRLVEGTLEYMLRIDYVLNQFSSVRVNKMKPVIRNILRSGVYQLMFMDSVPDPAACNEAVKLAQKKGFYSLKGFVNGVMRNVARKKEEIIYPDKNRDPEEYLSVYYSVPQWLVKRWVQTYGTETTECMLKDFLTDHPLTIRCQLYRVEQELTVNSLKGQGATVEQAPYLLYAFYLSDYSHLEGLKSFVMGRFVVQDVSSMLVTEAADPKPGDYVIDLCAAPGGKSLHVSELLNGTGTVEARDLTEYKIGLIEENVARVGNENIITKVSDATVLDKEAIEKADIVIADLPCSGLGVIGNKSDIKYNVTQNQIDELVELQRKILKQVSKYVKQGGKLLYSTCTVNRQENDSNVKWIQDNLPFKLQSLNGIVPEQLKCEKGCLQIYPGQYGMDGFFVSLFIRE